MQTRRWSTRHARGPGRYFELTSRAKKPTKLDPTDGRQPRVPVRSTLNTGPGLRVARMNATARQDIDPSIGMRSRSRISRSKVKTMTPCETDCMPCLPTPVPSSDSKLTDLPIYRIMERRDYAMHSADLSAEWSFTDTSLTDL